MKIGDRLRCTYSVNNVFGRKLFIKDNIYEILYIDKCDGNITLDHILYANEYDDCTIEFVNSHFINIREERKEKLQEY